MQLTYSLFPKFFQHLTIRQLAAVVRDVGLDTTNVIVRDNYWTTESTLDETLPAFMRAMRDEGLTVHFASTGYAPRALCADPTPLQLFADHGITEFRLGYFAAGDDDVRGAIRRANEELAALVPLCERYGVRAVYQLHHGTLIASASAAWSLVEGLPARWIGVELDPGNQAFEGMENWERSARLLGDHLVALGVKDVAIAHDPAAAATPEKGWTRCFSPIDEGITNWHAVMRALQQIDFTGTCVFMPFYTPDDPASFTITLAREVAYFRQVVATVESEKH